MPTDTPARRPPVPLERRVQRLTAAVAALAVGLALAVLWALLPRPALEARAFVLRDVHGAWRGGLVMDPEGNPTLRLNDVNARAILYGVIRDDGTPRLRLSDSTGRSRIALEVFPDGTPHAQLLDANGRTGVHAWLDPDGRPVVDVRWGAAYRRFTLPDSTAAEATGPARRRGR